MKNANWGVLLPCLVLPLCITAAVLALNGADDEDGTAVALQEIPAAAREALAAAAGGHAIETVLLDSEDGVDLYEGRWTIDGVVHEATVTAGGDVTELEVAVEAGRVPAAVQEEARRRLPAGATITYEKKLIVVYSCEAEVDGEAYEIELTPSGDELDGRGEDEEEEGEDEDADDDDD